MFIYMHSNVQMYFALFNTFNANSREPPFHNMKVKNVQLLNSILVEGSTFYILLFYNPLEMVKLIQLN